MDSVNVSNNICKKPQNILRKTPLQYNIMCVKPYSFSILDSCAAESDLNKNYTTVSFYNKNGPKIKTRSDSDLLGDFNKLINNNRVGEFSQFVKTHNKTETFKKLCESTEIVSHFNISLTKGSEDHRLVKEYGNENGLGSFCIKNSVAILKLSFASKKMDIFDIYLPSIRKDIVSMKSILDFMFYRLSEERHNDVCQSVSKICAPLDEEGKNIFCALDTVYKDKIEKYGLKKCVPQRNISLLNKATDEIKSNSFTGHVLREGIFKLFKELGKCSSTFILQSAEFIGEKANQGFISTLFYYSSVFVDIIVNALGKMLLSSAIEYFNDPYPSNLSNEWQAKDFVDKVQNFYTGECNKSDITYASLGSNSYLCGPPVFVDRVVEVQLTTPLPHEFYFLY